ncbi:MAG TPA: hypothetical protein VIH31_00995 [Candidatus Paceibacterota bacterium]
MEIATTLPLTFLKEEQGIRLFQDSNKLLYFSRGEMQSIVEGPHGSPQGFKKIEVFEKIVQCTTVVDFFYVYLRGRDEWLMHKESFDFYEGKHISLTADFVQLSVARSPRNHHSIFLFKENRFVPVASDYIDDPGYFKKCEQTGMFQGKKALLISPDMGYGSPDKMVYFIEENSFLTIPLPAEVQKEGKQYTVKVFFFIAPKYVVLKYGYSFEPKYFVWDLERKTYIALCKVNEKIINIQCTDKYLACLVKSDTSNKPDWKVLDSDTWKEVKGNFKVNFSSDHFSGVKVEEGKMTVSFDLSEILTEILK